MADDLFGDGSNYASRWQRIYAEADFRAEQIRLRAHPCAVCGESMLDWPGRTTHFSCDPNTLAGKVCTCPNGCSGTAWGNGPAPCDPACVPCKRMAGVTFTKKKGG
ncbi:MAG: hypothetical protein EHM63_09825 [Actinobacteria bacterium]|nr:MAG: hypothetical protein EHM63_09825 [Actinomycetota bacterium]